MYQNQERRMNYLLDKAEFDSDLTEAEQDELDELQWEWENEIYEPTGKDYQEYGC